MYIGKVNPGDKLTGIIVGVDYDEILVDTGTKYTGYVKRKDIMVEPSVPLSTLFQAGEKHEFIVNKIDDVAGIIKLKPADLHYEKSTKKNQTIVNDVIGRIQNELTGMKPSLISEIALSVYAQLEKNYGSENQELRNRVSELEKRVLQLEDIIDRLI